MAEEADSVRQNPESAASCHSEAGLGPAAGTQLSAQLAESRTPGEMPSEGVPLLGNWETSSWEAIPCKPSRGQHLLAGEHPPAMAKGPNQGIRHKWLVRESEVEGDGLAYPAPGSRVPSWLCLQLEWSVMGPAGCRQPPLGGVLDEWLGLTTYTSGPPHPPLST